MPAICTQQPCCHEQEAGDPYQSLWGAFEHDTKLVQKANQASGPQICGFLALGSPLAAAFD